MRFCGFAVSLFLHLLSNGESHWHSGSFVDCQKFTWTLNVTERVKG